MKRILLGLITIVGAASALYVGATGAFFSDTETSTGNTFAAGDIDLLIDNTSYYNGVFNEGTSWLAKDLVDEKFFNFDDLKPGDWGEDTISIHVDTNDAYLCANVTLTSNDDNAPTEPELLDDTDTGVGLGELADLVNFVWWADDGDNVLEDDETVISQGPIGALEIGVPHLVALADSDENIWGDAGPVPGDTTRYIGKAWCFGTLEPAPLAQDGQGPESPRTPANSTGGISCADNGIDNASQTDSLTADISFEAMQARNNPTFQCEEPEEPPTFGECTAGQQYADAAGLFDQGTRKDGAAVLANRSVASAAFGMPQTSGGPSDVGFPAGSFVSLGFKLQDGPPHGSLVLDFSDNVVVNEGGADLKIYETTGGVYPDEKVMVEISQDGVTWHTAAASVTRDAEIDIDGLPIEWARYVRVTDVSDISLFPSDADAYDLDAIEALNCAVLQENGGGNEEPNDEELPDGGEGSLFFDNFGTGNTDTTFDEPPGWEEGGLGASKRNSAGGGDESISDGDGGRKAAMFAGDGYICRSIDATGYTNLNLEYSWRGDSDAEAGDNGVVEYATGGTCAAPTGLITIATHPLTTTTWQDNSVSLGAVDNSIFFLRFRNLADTTGEDFRVDAVNVTGTI